VQLREDSKGLSLPDVINSRQSHKIIDHPFRQLFGSAYAHLQVALDEELSSSDVSTKYVSLVHSE